MAVALSLAGDAGAGRRREARPALPAAELGDAAQILAGAIRFATVNPPGNELEAAHYFVDLLRSRAVETRVVVTPSGASSAGRALAWARLRGNGTRRPIVLLSHLDVVPADHSSWGVDPFAGAVDDGYVVGRGALDAKGVAVVHLLALAELARSGAALERDLIFLATPDEESGGLDGAGWVVRQAPELLGRAEFLLTEGGGILAGDGPGIWGVAVTEKSPCWLRISTRGAAGHSSAPSPDASVPRLVAALDRVRRIETPIQVVPEVAGMFAALAARAPPADAAAFRDLQGSLERDPEFRARFVANPHWNALVRDTHTLTVLRGSARTNVVPAEAVAHLDARLLPGGSCQEWRALVRGVIADPGVELEPLLAFGSRASPVDSPLFRAIERVAAQTEPGALVVPRMTAGFTDAHYFRELGITAYGFVPRWLEPGESRRVHGPNERISIENLERGTRTLMRILRALDQEDPGEAPRAASPQARRAGE